ncbi:TonB-dependent receptor [Mangrovivirga sp. M17]|uniref:TonB-dependent receptor n=1 Tax=Mangrovivirga halotolerans TaxID=2993936 RepID=A0ABT3RRI6_9BACT|nr:TonB-dependent receptor [Mangrovivirga halotolerans]MCX2744401.1 TonB-dependent receptor [Mangrovivirga halotolerans]
MRVVFTLCSLIFSIWCVSGQSETNVKSEITLEKILSDLEQIHQVRFSYIDTVVAGKTVVPFDYESNTLHEVVFRLERLSSLNFITINEKNIVVRPFSEDDKVNVCGYLKEMSAEPIINAVLKITGDKIVTQSDKRGYFEFTNVPFGSNISVDHLGFISLDIPVKELYKDKCPHVNLTERLNELPEITLSDFLIGGMSKVNNEIILKPDELGILPGLIEPDILKSIQQLPGVNGPFETASGVFVRGTSPDMNLVKWNGIKTYNQSHFFGMLSAFNPFVTDEVLFIKNGVSAEYGDRISGVIDVRSDNTINNDFKGSAGLNMIYGDVFLKVPIIKNKLSATVSARRSFNDFLETFTYDSYSDRVFQNTRINEVPATPGQTSENDFYFNDFTTGVNYRINNRNNISFNSLYTKNDLEFRSGEQDLNYTDRLKTENEGYNLKWIHNSHNFTVETEAYYSGYLLNYHFMRSLPSTEENSFKNNSVDDLGFNATVSFDLNKKGRVKTGYQFSNNQVQYEFKNTGPGYTLILDQADEVLNTHSLFGQYDLSVNKSSIKAGLRINHYSELRKTYFEPRIALEQNLSNNFYFNATAEYRTQTVSQIRESVVSDLSLENQVWSMASNDGFPVIESYQFSTGFAYDNNGWLVDIEGYYREIENITTLTFGFLNPVDNEFRLGNSSVRGSDVLIKKQVGNNFRSWASYSYLFSENQFTGLNDDQPFPGNWNIEHTIKWTAYYQIKSLQLSLGWTWHTGKTFTSVTVDESGAGPLLINYGELNGSNLPIYHRLDFSMMYEFGGGQKSDIRYRVGASVLNLYDRENLLNREFRTTPGIDNSLIDNRIYGLGITPNVTFRVFW